jgi:hypothetical protein
VDANLIDHARTSIHSVFQTGASQSPEGVVKALVSILESGKEQWSFLLIRKLADALLECRQGRRISFRHESRWMNLTGFCLRPGFGDPLDEWRIREAWKLFPQGLQFPRETQGRTEWWIFWRRIAGGVTAGQQLQLYQSVTPGLQATEPGRKKGSVKPWRGQEELEIWMMLANLERLPVKAKEELGTQLLEKIRKGNPKPCCSGHWAVRRQIHLRSSDRAIPGHGPRVAECLLSLPIPATGSGSSARSTARFHGRPKRRLPKDRDRLPNGSDNSSGERVPGGPFRAGSIASKGRTTANLWRVPTPRSYPLWLIPRGK